MRIFTLITLTLTVFSLTFTSCGKKKSKKVTNTPVNVYDSSDKALEEEKMSIEESISVEENDSANAKEEPKTAPAKTEEVRKTKAPVEAVKKADVKKLMKYNVVIATLSQPAGVKRLSDALDKDGIEYFVARSNGYYLFVVGSADSEDAAIEARKNFLLKATVNKSRQDIWKQYDILVTDTYILERR